MLNTHAHTHTYTHKMSTMETHVPVVAPKIISSNKNDDRCDFRMIVSHLPQKRTYHTAPDVFQCRRIPVALVDH